MHLSSHGQRCYNFVMFCSILVLLALGKKKPPHLSTRVAREFQGEAVSWNLSAQKPRDKTLGVDSEWMHPLRSARPKPAPRHLSSEGDVRMNED